MSLDNFEEKVVNVVVNNMKDIALRAKNLVEALETEKEFPDGLTPIVKIERVAEEIEALRNALYIK